MSFDVGELQCTVTHEVLADSGESQKRTVYRNTTLLLGRNEFRDILLKMTLGKRDFKIRLKDITVHKKFAKDGKATIKLNNQNIQFMISNCPPDKLIMFLKTMSTKLICQSQKPVINDRQRLLSDKPRVFEEISPMVLQELQTVHNMRAKAEENKTDLFTPKGKLKRKRDPTDGKENWPPKSHKQARRDMGLTLPTKSLSQKILAPVVLTKEQKKVLEVVKSGKNVFFTGSAGTGKSFLLKRIIGALAPQHAFATASTGVAACHIGGTTLHAFAGIGSGRATIEQCVELASRPTVAQQWKKCRHLIIDEISMVEGDMFDKLELVARVVRQNNDPFGGIQLILCGDFLQLPPVTKHGQKRKFAFQSKAWRKCIDVNLELTDVRRQSDQTFINILQNIRLGRCPPDVSTSLTATSRHCIDKDGILATRLCTHKEDVEQINSVHLRKLTTPPRDFSGTDSDPNLVKFIDVQCPVANRIQLKEGAQVMLAKNLDVQRGLVNGARGVVTGFEANAQGLPIVKFMCGETCTIHPERWTIKVASGLHITRKQLPLKLAWAISIHKSQGMSLDCVEMSLSRVFESGQAYVALSRARSIEGLRVVDFDRKCVRADPDVLQFYRRMHTERGEQTVMQKYIILDSQGSQLIDSQ